jgi:hypothetical protein
METIDLQNTSTKHYLTGMTALNIPTEDGKVADWHFVSALLDTKRKLRVAGINIADTNGILGSYGIRECSSILKKRGVVLNSKSKVYSADFVRAILDLIYDNILNEHCPKHIEIDELLEYEEDKKAFLKQYNILKSTIQDNTQLTLLNSWENAQTF